MYQKQLNGDFDITAPNDFREYLLKGDENIKEKSIKLN